MYVSLCEHVHMSSGAHPGQVVRSGAGVTMVVSCLMCLLGIEFRPSGITVDIGKIRIVYTFIVLKILF